MGSRRRRNDGRAGGLLSAPFTFWLVEGSTVTSTSIVEAVPRL